MRIASLFLLTALLVGACQTSPEGTESSSTPSPEAPAAKVLSAAPAGYDAFGDPISADAAMPVEMVVAAPATYVGQTVKLKGAVAEVCQMKGCWFTLRAPEGRNIRLMVPRDDAGNYVYTMPTDISGRTAIVEGVLHQETLDEAAQRHLAEDAGEPLEGEIAAQTELQLIPKGVLLASDV